MIGRAASLVVLVAAIGCGSRTRSLSMSASAPAEYPCVLHAPRTIPNDFMVRQALTIHARREGKPADAELDAVVQKQGDALLIVGFGPLNVKVFTLRHRDDRIEFTQLAGPDLPFSPRNILVDVHRVFFKHLPPPKEAGHTGVLRGELDGEVVEETWRDGQLATRVFTRPGSPLRGAVRIEFAEGCAPDRCEPVSVSLKNEWFDYSLTIVNDVFERL